ncbi:NAD(P)/FAD-dependent oxidoreductase [Kitasatospora viridis]|uniref:Flavin-dependent dehydrogenase n=1 Tax=Kitasatospora viridis TaxID=281105 RepID=A0A561UDC8_9ACTN|nr:FAD-dependent oxidoreductase [Kitasatospora viridis]TWF97374.1 flavin-dependent dehydrogenase [Kitasatospora viridis]
MNSHPHIAIIGGGITGLAAALFLGRQGHRVTLLEREARAVSSDLDGDFVAWNRPSTPQALQPHLLRAPIRNVLRAAAPDVYAELLSLGATEHHDLAAFGPSLPEDVDLVTLRARRILLEAALSRAVQAEPTVTLRTDTPVTGLLTNPGEVPRVTGVRTAAGDITADLTLDAAGRRSHVHRWLAAAGARPPVTELQRTGIAYFCRWYRIDQTKPYTEPPRTGCLTPYVAFGVFPADNGCFALAVSISVEDPTRTALRDPEVYDAAARLFPSGAAWLALPHQPVSDVQIMAGLPNLWTALHDDQGPQVHGLLSIGDSAIHTNPTLGQGISLAILAADWLARQDPVDPGLPTAYHQFRVDTLRPWFDTQVGIDRARQDQVRDALRGVPDVPAPLERSALSFCAEQDIVVARARAQVAQMLRTPPQAYATPEIQDRVGAWLRANPEFTGPPPGPSRELWEQTVGRG